MTYTPSSPRPKKRSFCTMPCPGAIQCHLREEGRIMTRWALASARLDRLHGTSRPERTLPRSRTDASVSTATVAGRPAGSGLGLGA